MDVLRYNYISIDISITRKLQLTELLIILTINFIRIIIHLQMYYIYLY